MNAFSALRVASVIAIGVLGSAGFAGCNFGGPTAGPTQSETKPVSGGKETIKSRLSEIASSGIGGSAVSGLREGIQELKSTDAALAEDLLRQLSELEKLQDSEKIKDLAGKMAAKL